jgi:hypothetical protein
MRPRVHTQRSDVGGDARGRAGQRAGPHQRLEAVAHPDHGATRLDVGVERVAEAMGEVERPQLAGAQGVAVGEAAGQHHHTGAVEQVRFVEQVVHRGEAHVGACLGEGEGGVAVAVGTRCGEDDGGHAR